MTLPSLISASASLAGIVLVLLLAGHLARRTRFGRLPASGRMQVADKLAIDPKRRLVMVTCDGHTLVLLTGGQDIVVGWLPGSQS